MKYVFFLVVSSLVFLSCAANIKNLTKTQYSNPIFTKESLNEGGLALLPITAGLGQEGYRRPLGDYMNQDLQAAVPEGKVLTWQETMELLNKNSKVETYEALIQAYRQTSILDRNKVKELFSALGVKYALYCSLQDYSESKETNYNFLTGLNTTKTANVSAHCLIMDLESGDIMEEIIGQATSVAGNYQYNQGYEEYAKILANSVLSQLPGAKVPNLKSTN